VVWTLESFLIHKFGGMVRSRISWPLTETLKKAWLGKIRPFSSVPGKVATSQVQVIEAPGTASLNNEHESLFPLVAINDFPWLCLCLCLCLVPFYWCKPLLQVRPTISSTDFRSDTSLANLNM
jgi:hypothetical protein